VRLESGSYYDLSPYLVISMAKQTADAWIGGFLLVLGFSGQLVSSLGWNPAWACLALTLPLAIGLDIAAFASLIFVLRPWNVRRTIEHLLVARRESDRLEPWTPAIIWLSRAQGSEIRAGERPADLAAWLIGEKRWRRVIVGVELPADVTEPYEPGQG